MAAGYDISASVSESLTSASRAGEGDFIVYGGGAKQSLTMYYVAGVVALVGLFLWLRYR